MKRRIFGFQRRVWWPKCTPASSSSRMETTDIGFPFWLGLLSFRRGSGGTGIRRTPAPPPRRRRRVVGRPPMVSAPFVRILSYMAVEGSRPIALGRLAEELRGSSLELALEVVEEGLAEDQIPSMARLGREGQLGDVPTFSDGFDSELRRAHRYGHGLSLVYLDIDNFKQLNDTRGHPEGDRVLREVARLLGEGLRSSDLAGRMGGDEFAVGLIESDAAAADGFLARLTKRIAES